MFKILKYIQPTWYFNLKPDIDNGYFPIAEFLNSQKVKIEPDILFSKQAIDFEMAYRAHKMGYIDLSYRNGIDWWSGQQVSTLDEYIFARKYFHVSRIWIAFFIRVLSFHNAIREIKAFYASKKVKRVKIYQKDIDSDKFDLFNSTLVKSAPLVSVIIPTLNRYSFLETILHDFEKQNYKNFEIIVVDQSDPFQPEFYKRFLLNIKVFHQKEKALWLARNSAIKNASGELIALSEDDVRIPEDWISNHLKCLDFYKADISAGVFFPEGGKIPEEKNFFRWADQFATGNACLKKDVFRKIGLFDRQFEKQRMGDGEFGLRAFLAGFRAVSNPYSWCEDIKAPIGGLRQSGSWDAYRPKSLWSPRPVPSVLYFYRKYFGARASIISLLYNIPSSVVPYRFKRNRKMLLAGSILSLPILPLIVIQVIRSWVQATKMLKKPMIDKIDE